MLIAIDYDDTFTRDSLMWGAFISHAVARRHRVVVCTGRAFPPTDDFLWSQRVEVYCTGGQAKRDYLAAQGLRPDVWIDDDPASILTDGV